MSETNNRATLFGAHLLPDQFRVLAFDAGSALLGQMPLPVEERLYAAEFLGHVFDGIDVAAEAAVRISESGVTPAGGLAASEIIFMAQRSVKDRELNEEGEIVYYDMQKVSAGVELARVALEDAYARRYG